MLYVYVVTVPLNETTYLSLDTRIFSDCRIDFDQEFHLAVEAETCTIPALPPPIDRCLTPPNGSFTRCVHMHSDTLTHF